MSADVLRRASALMRERAEKSTSGPWEFRPRRGFQSMGDDPATIGFLDTAGYFVMLREGTWATEGDMEYVASWHPAVALAVADWMECEALSVEGHAALVATHAQMDDCGCAYKDCFECGKWCRCTHVTPKPKGALTVARAYLGEVDA